VIVASIVSFYAHPKAIHHSIISQQVRREEIESRIDEKFSVERQQEMEKAKQALEEHKERANAIREILRKKEEEHQVQNLVSQTKPFCSILNQALNILTHFIR